jgi:hypothetical protein
MRNNSNRRAKSKRTQQDANRTTTRVLNRITNEALLTNGPNGGTVLYATLLNPLSSFQGYDSLVNQYDQYQITNFEVYARPDTVNQVNLNAINRFAAIYTAANNTTVSTYVDYDSYSAPNEQQFLGRDALKIRSLAGGTYRLIAKYRPRVRFSDSVNNLPALVTNNQWVNSEFADLDWLGLAMRFTSDSGLWGNDATNCLKVQLFIKATVRFRGLKKPSSTVALSNPVTTSSNTESTDTNNSNTIAPSPRTPNG